MGHSCPSCAEPRPNPRLWTTSEVWDIIFWEAQHARPPVSYFHFVMSFCPTLYDLYDFSRSIDAPSALICRATPFSAANDAFTCVLLSTRTTSWYVHCVVLLQGVQSASCMPLNYPRTCRNERRLGLLVYPLMSCHGVLS